MSDHDPLESLARNAADQVLAPDFDDLVAVSKRRRRVGYLATGCVAAAVIGVVAIGVQAADTDQSGPVHPGPTTTTVTTGNPPPKGSHVAEAIVDNPAAQLRSVAVLPGRPGARAVVWQVPGRGVALAVTPDDFHTRTCLLLHGSFPSVSAVGGGAFYVPQRGRGLLVTPDGAPPRTVSRSPIPAAVAPGEFLALQRDGASLAVDPASATAHPLELPAQSRAAYGDRALMWSIPVHVSASGVAHSSVSWSMDGGDTWATHVLPPGQLAIFTQVPSGPGTMVVSETGDGNTIPPLSKVVYSLDAGATWETAQQPDGRVAGVAWTAALPDGSFLADVLAWNGERAGQRDGASHGLFASVDNDWTQLVPVQPALPGDAGKSTSALGDLVSTTLTGSRSALYVSSSPSGELLVSMDDGRTWATVKDR